MLRTCSCIGFIGVSGLVLATVPAFAECGTIGGSGRAADPMNFDPPRRYDMVTAAKVHAVGAWKKEVRARCPGSSTSWEKARRKNIACEGYAGGTACTATATPSE
jgi:hypothetical protein